MFSQLKTLIAQLLAATALCNSAASATRSPSTARISGSSYRSATMRLTPTLTEHGKSTRKVSALCVPTSGSA